MKYELKSNWQHRCVCNECNNLFGNLEGFTVCRKCGSQNNSMKSVKITTTLSIPDFWNTKTNTEIKNGY